MVVLSMKDPTNPKKQKTKYKHKGANRGGNGEGVME